MGVGIIVKIPKKYFCVYHICGIVYHICGSKLPHMWYTIPQTWYTIPQTWYTIPQTWIPRKSLYWLTLYMVWWNCPDDSKKVKQLYVDLMLLVISLLTLLMSVGFNNHLILTQYVIRWVGLVLRFLTIYNTCMFV